MLRFRHSLIAALVALALVLTGHSAAMMRMMPGPAGEIVLCTGSGPLTVMVDENGQPVGPPHVCPDCVLSLFAELPQQAPLVLPLRALAAQRHPAAGRTPAARDDLPAQARGPPPTA